MIQSECSEILEKRRKRHGYYGCCDCCRVDSCYARFHRWHYGCVLSVEGLGTVHPVAVVHGPDIGTSRTFSATGNWDCPCCRHADTSELASSRRQRREDEHESCSCQRAVSDAVCDVADWLGCSPVHVKKNGGVITASTGDQIGLSDEAVFY